MILPPFAGELNGFTLLFEAFIIKFCKHVNVELFVVKANIFNKPRRIYTECLDCGV
jgi:hypothetical protein